MSDLPKDSSPAATHVTTISAQRSTARAQYVGDVLMLREAEQSSLQCSSSRQLPRAKSKSAACLSAFF